jgi:SAM-dependent methyltransferase
MEWFEDENFWRDFYPYIFSPDRFLAAKDEVSQIAALTRCSGGRVLDLCCGPGRHAVELAHRNFLVTGIDTSAFLLDRAREHGAAVGVSIEWILEDMRCFIRPAGFDLACNLFNSFGYFQNEHDDLRVLRNIHASLKENGVLIIDVLGKERLARTWQSASCTEFADGALLVQRPKVHSDLCRLSTDWTLIKDDKSRSVKVEHTLYSGRELKDRLLNCGFRSVQLFGDLLGSAYNLYAKSLVAIARK